MSGLGLAWTWCVIQITILGLAGVIVYFVARRLGPAVGSLVASTTLVLTSCLTILAFLPLPGWTAHLLSQNVSSTDSGARVPSAASAAADAPTESTPDPQAAKLSTDFSSVAKMFSEAFGDEFSRLADAKPARTPPRWWAAGGILFLLVAAISLMRIAFSFQAVRQLRKRTVPVRDIELAQQLKQLASELGKHPLLVQIRESSELNSAATWGWLRPIIVLPIEWREWSAPTLRAVLAHELAHVVRRDYLMWLLAQIGVALHAYHPVVHWLARRLRQDQECAADVAACRVVGDPRAYLSVLATMAIEQDDRRLSWSAHPFLPSRRTFLRRIEMLRDLKRVPLPPPRSARWAAVTALLALAILASGFRAIRTGSEALGQPPKPRLGEAAQAPASGASQEAIRFDYFPRDTAVAMVARPSRVLSNPLLKNHQEAIAALETAVSTQLGVKLSEIDQISAVLLMTEKAGRGPEEPCLIIRLAKPLADVNTVANVLAPNATTSTYGEYKVYASNRSFCAFPDERTIVAANDQGLLRRILVSGPNATQNQSVASTWSKAVDSEGAFFVNTAQLRELLNAGIQQAPQQQGAVLGALAPLWQKTNSIAGGIQIRDQVQIQVFANAEKPEDVRAVKDTLAAAMTFARNMLSMSRAAASREEGQHGPILLKSIDLAESMLDEIEVTEEGTLVVARGAMSGDQAAELTKVLAVGSIAARSAAQRTHSMNNMKQLGLAMHNYYDAHQHFPPAAVVGPDGKTLHSWRVEILPYIEQEALYREYRMDEPWDSPNNMKVLEKMPAIFRDPSNPMDSKSSSYYVVTGEGTVFHGNKGTQFQTITDGTSNTILIVEAKRDIPWTKPEDIEFNGQQLPELGGHYEEGFLSTFADGSVRFIQKAVDPNTLKALLLKGDGMAVAIP